jgi:hypothetical protein
MKASDVGDRAIDRLSLPCIERSFGRSELRRADFDRRKGNAIELTRELEQCRVAACAHVADDLTYSFLDCGRIRLRWTAQHPPAFVHGQR